MKRLKIAVVIDIFDSSCGGGMTSAVRIVQELREHHDVVVITTDIESPGIVTVPSYTPLLPFIKDIMKKRDFVFGVPDQEILEKTIQAVDIVHVKLPFLLSYRAISIARKMNKPVLSSFHVQAENILYNLHIGGKTAQKIFYALAVHRIYNRTDVVICPTAFAQKELLKYGLTSRSEIVSNGIPKKFRRDISIERSSKEFTILSVGRFSIEKRQTIIIEAIKKSKYAHNIKLILSGHGPLEKELQKQILTLPVQAEFGCFSEDELVVYYNTANLYVHASDVELESLSVLESIGCGLTALISDSPSSASKQFAPHDSFVFRGGDSLDLATRIDYWYENKDELERWHSKVLADSSQYHLEKTIVRLEELYHEVLAKEIETN